ncbi:protein WVD2-like 7 isoform X2 [Humulus lupulus]|uniref:protein WVD2-like 7 isoform X2 n=1 Tax=Humulus lupulus TaxID=3486 RepID=UPI002B40388B|nr:protein WVD2-like 7 isoform X2 [Humulus lupulus]
MGESAFLRRSFSSPSESSREPKEGDPCRALGESISFGRFMSEPLAWEKWSAFTHNRYLEEVERYSKPGSVAEKKAYFEAHYKKKAAERAAALLEAANVKTTDEAVTESVTPEEKNCNDSSMDSELEKRESLVDEQHEIDVPNTDYCTNETKSNSSVDRGEKECSMTEMGEVVIQESIDMGSCDPIEIPNQSEKNEENISIEDVACQNITASTSKQRLANSSPRTSSKQVTPIQTRNGNNLASRCKNFMQDLVDKKSAKSLHMSFHFSSRTGESSKPISPFRQKIISSKDLTASPKVFANNSTSQTKIKASVNGVVKRPSLTLKSENRSNSKSSSGKGSKSRSSIISSPFKFKSDERAAKRKEFYEKLEEKRYAEEAEKKRQQTRFQGKALQDIMKVRQSTGLKGKPNEDLCSASQLPTCHIKMMNQIPLRQPKSPTLVRKAFPNKIRDATFESSDNNESSKCIENNRTTIQSLASRFQRKNAHENASPNIQSSTVKKVGIILESRLL